jgi:hypothetical protein
MLNATPTSLQLGAAILADDPGRGLAVASPGDPKARHISIVGNTYTILLGGEDTDGRNFLIDMNVPPGGGPPTAMTSRRCSHRLKARSNSRRPSISPPMPRLALGISLAASLGCCVCARRWVRRSFLC